MFAFSHLVQIVAIRKRDGRVKPASFFKRYGTMELNRQRIPLKQVQ